MSGSTSAGPLTSVEIVDVRRFCGYPPASRTVGVDVIGRACGTLAQDEVDVVRAVYLSQLPTLELAISGAGAKLGIDTAAVFKRNAREVQEREGLFRQWRLRLCWMLGIDCGPYLDMVVPAAFVV